MRENELKKTENFGGLRGYYGYMSYHDGYGGFNYLSDFLYMNQSTWTNPNGVGYQYGWCDTGYQNEAAMSHARSLGWIYQYGVMESATGHSFTLTSMNVAASFSNDALWNIISYTEHNGQLQVKAVDPLYVSYTGAHVDLATLGQPADFKKIAAVAFQMVSYGSPGNTCTYGYAIFGVQLAVGDVRVNWSKSTDLDSRGGRLMTPWMLHHPSHTVPDPGALASHTPSDAHQSNSAYYALGVHGQMLPAGHEVSPIDHFFWTE